MTETLPIKTIRVSSSRLNEVDFHNISFGSVYSDHMFMATFNGKEWNKAEIKPFANLQLSPANATLHYSQTIFEGMKAYKNERGEPVLFRPMKNFERLNKSALRMCMPEIPEEVFMGGMKELIRLDQEWIPTVPGTSLYVRPFMFAADEYIGVKPSETYHFIIFTCPVGAYYPKPVKVKIETEFTRAAQGGVGFAKTGGNYAASLYPAQLANKQGYDQLLWTDGRNHEYIEESGTMNAVFVINNKIVTAAVSDNILNGVTRDSVLQLARDWGYEVEVRPLAVRELIQALENGDVQEAFGTGTAATIAHIETIGYEGQDYQLPEIAGREFSNRALKTLNDMKIGEAPDPHGWVVKV
jgi:branched-chain amino acid aminotransferase